MKKNFVEYLGKQIPVPKIKTKPEEQTIQEDVHEDILLAEQTPADMANASHTSMTIEVPPEPVAPPTVVQTNKEVSDSVLESLVVMLNQILQELAAIHQKLDAQKTTTEEVESAPKKRKIMLVYADDDPKRIIGANVIDEE